jgi:hypothetical protein
VTDEFKPTVLSADQERDQVLRPKIAALESDRIQQALEAEALRDLGQTTELNDGERSELNALERGVARLDARLAVHRARLAELE